jgi:hypothetical protein
VSAIRRLGRIVKSADRRPAPATLLLWGLCFVGLRVWSVLDHAPVLLARADPARRADVYGQVASTSVALLAVSLTVLAILYALPDRPTVQEMRDSDTWPALQGLLLMIALLCMIAVVTAHVGTAVDHHKPGIEWLEQLMLASAAISVLALMVAGIVFAAVLYVSAGPKDPSQGRGSLAGKTD